MRKSTKAFALLALGACALVASMPSQANMDDVQRALVEERYFDAFVELQDLAEDGNPEAQFELAGFHHYGRIGPVNFEKARAWYMRAANQGNVDAMIGLAVIYGHGQGVPKDPAIAYQWLKIASLASPGAEDAAAIADGMAALKSQLSAEQLAGADAAAAGFVPKAE